MIKITQYKLLVKNLMNEIKQQSIQMRFSVFKQKNSIINITKAMDQEVHMSRGSSINSQKMPEFQNHSLNSEINGEESKTPHKTQGIPNQSQDQFQSLLKFQGNQRIQRKFFHGNELMKDYPQYCNYKHQIDEFPVYKQRDTNNSGTNMQHPRSHQSSRKIKYNQQKSSRSFSGHNHTVQSINSKNKQSRTFIRQVQSKVLRLIQKINHSKDRLTQNQFRCIQYISNILISKDPDSCFKIIPEEIILIWQKNGIKLDNDAWMLNHSFFSLNLTEFLNCRWKRVQLLDISRTSLDTNDWILFCNSGSLLPDLKVLIVKGNHIHKIELKKLQTFKNLIFIDFGDLSGNCSIKDKQNLQQLRIFKKKKNSILKVKFYDPLEPSTTSYSKSEFFY